MTVEQQPRIFPEASFREWDRVRAVTRPFFEAYYPFVDEHLGDAGAILDLAGGDGHTYDVLAPEITERLTTVDFDELALERLRNRIPEATAVSVPIDQLPFENESFDAAIAINGFDSENFNPATLNEIGRVLKSGSKLLFLRDMAPDLLSSVIYQFKKIPKGAPYTLTIFPSINPETGDVDILELTTGEFIELASKNNALVRLLFHRLQSGFGSKWQSEIYEDDLKLADIAMIGAKLAMQLRIVEREKGLESVEPVTASPPFHENAVTAIANTFQGTKFRYETTYVEVDRMTDEGLVVNGKPIESMWMDREVIPHFKAKKLDQDPSEPTRVHGAVPLYVAQKR